MLKKIILIYGLKIFSLKNMEDDKVDINCNWNKFGIMAYYDKFKRSSFMLKN